MNTSRPSSRNQYSASNGGSLGVNNVNSGSTTPGMAPPRRAKIASMAQMDISPIGFQPKSNNTNNGNGSATSSLPGSGTSTPTNSSRGGGGGTLASSGYGFPLVSNHSSNNNNSNINHNGSNGNNSNSPIGYNSNNSTPPPRLSSNARVRSSNSVTTTASFRSVTGNQNGSTGGGSGSVGSSNNSSRRDGGSVTSDDGTVSEDSDLARDDTMQLFSGAGSGGGHVNLPFGTPSSGRHSATGGPKIASGGTLSRHRTSPSAVGYNNGSSVGTTGAKPMRIAAGASIKIDSVPNMNSLSHSSMGASSGSTVGSYASPINSSASMPVWTTTPSSSSHLGVGSLSRNGSIRKGNSNNNNSNNGDDGSSVVSMNSAVSSSTNTIRSVKGGPTTPAAAAGKLAEENRRAEEAARTRRKIADLEISNASLLSINQSLEATIRKQASEVQELKLRMQSSQFGEFGYTAADLALAHSVDAIELTEAEKHDDLTFKRLCLSIEQMVYEAKQALDQVTRPAGVKVLTLYDMYEKEVAEEAEEEDVEDEEHPSFSQDHGENDFSIEVIDQDENLKEQLRGHRDENGSLPSSLRNSMISSATMEVPLTMVT